MGCNKEFKITKHEYSKWRGDCDQGHVEICEEVSPPFLYVAASATPSEDDGRIILAGSGVDDEGNILIGRQGLYNFRTRVQIVPRLVDTNIAIRVFRSDGSIPYVFLLEIPAGSSEALAVVDLALIRGDMIVITIDQAATIIRAQQATINGEVISASGTLFQLRFIGCVGALPPRPPAPRPIPPILV